MGFTAAAPVKNKTVCVKYKRFVVLFFFFSVEKARSGYESF
jgi:hypothetical protein